MSYGMWSALSELRCWNFVATWVRCTGLPWTSSLQPSNAPLNPDITDRQPGTYRAHQALPSVQVKYFTHTTVTLWFLVQVATNPGRSQYHPVNKTAYCATI